MRYIRNAAGNRIVDATPEETHALRPALRACFRRWRAPEGDIEDFCQDVEIIAWRGIVDQRIQGDGFARPVDALLDFMFMVAWNIWRNHSRKRSTRSELFFEEMPDIAGPDPTGRMNARETLLRLSTEPDIVRILLEAVNVPPAVRYAGIAKSTYGYGLTKARKWAREVDAGRWREPAQQTPTQKIWTRRRKG